MHLQNYSKSFSGISSTVTVHSSLICFCFVNSDGLIAVKQSACIRGDPSMDFVETIDSLPPDVCISCLILQPFSLVVCCGHFSVIFGARWPSQSWTHEGKTPFIHGAVIPHMVILLYETWRGQISRICCFSGKFVWIWKSVFLHFRWSIRIFPPSTVWEQHVRYWVEPPPISDSPARKVLSNWKLNQSKKLNPQKNGIKSKAVLATTSGSNCITFPGGFRLHFRSSCGTSLSGVHSTSLAILGTAGGAAGETEDWAPKTNKCPLKKWWLEDDSFPSEMDWFFFRGRVRFRGCNLVGTGETSEKNDLQP